MIALLPLDSSGLPTGRAALGISSQSRPLVELLLSRGKEKGHAAVAADQKLVREHEGAPQAGPPPMAS